MGSYLDSAGLTQVWGKLKDKIDAAKEVKSLTKTEYDALEEKEQNVIYSVTDGEGYSATTSIWLNGIVLNDVSYNKKINNFYVNKLYTPGSNLVEVQDVYISDSENKNVLFNISTLENNKLHIFHVDIRDTIEGKLLVNDVTVFIYKETNSRFYVSNNQYINTAKTIPYTYTARYVRIKFRADGSKLRLHVALYPNADLSVTDSRLEGYVKGREKYAEFTNIGEFHKVPVIAGSIDSPYVGTNLRSISLVPSLKFIDGYIVDGAKLELAIFSFNRNNDAAGSSIESNRGVGLGSINFIIRDGFSSNSVINKYAEYNITLAHDKENLVVNQICGSSNKNIIKEFIFSKHSNISGSGSLINEILYFEVWAILTEEAKGTYASCGVIGNGNAVMNFSNYDISGTKYSFTPINGSKIQVNDKVVFTTEKDYTDVNYIPLSQSNYKNNDSLYVITDYSNKMTSIEENIEISTEDNLRTFDCYFENDVEFKVGDCFILPKYSGYSSADTVYGNLIYKVISVTSSNSLIAYCTNQNPTEIDENRLPISINKGETINVDYISPVTEDVNTTFSSIITYTNKYTQDRDTWTNGYGYYYSATIADASKFKVNDIVIVPSLSGYYANIISGNLLLKIIDIDYFTNKITFFICNSSMDDAENMTAPTVTTTTELKLYSRL